MLYPITVDVLHQVFSPHGFVEKMVTFQKSAGQLLQVFCLFLSVSVYIKFVVLQPLNICWMGQMSMLFCGEDTFQLISHDWQ